MPYDVIIRREPARLILPLFSAVLFIAAFGIAALTYAQDRGPGTADRSSAPLGLKPAQSRTPFEKQMRQPLNVKALPVDQIIPALRGKVPDSVLSDIAPHIEQLDVPEKRNDAYAAIEALVKKNCTGCELPAWQRKGGNATATTVVPESSDPWSTFIVQAPKSCGRCEMKISNVCTACPSYMPCDKYSQKCMPR